MTFVVRNSVRVLLINQVKLLLMRMEDFDISSVQGTKNKIFWCTVGGKIEPNETVEQAALREIYEETGIVSKDLELGPLVWSNKIDLNLKGILTRFNESYIVVHTKQHNVALHNPTQEELDTVKALKWFSMAEINESKEPIFPTFLKHYLPDIIAGNYPIKTIKMG